MATKSELEQTLADERQVIEDLQNAYGALSSENVALTQERDLLLGGHLSAARDQRDAIAQEKADLQTALDLKERQAEILVRRLNNIHHEVTAVGEELGRLQ